MPYLHGTLSSSLLQSKAAACGQKEQWQQAQTQMHQLIIDNPDQPDLLYDSGVAAYRLSEFTKAAAYFENVTKIPQVQNDLKKQAHFNLGNTNVALNQLPQAITQYEQVIAMDPDNQPARHNLEKVKEMLKQQQKQNQQQQQKKDQSKNNQQDNNDQRNQDQQQNQQSNQDQQNQNNEQQQQNGSQKKDDANGSSADSSSHNQGNDESLAGNQKEKKDTNGQQRGQQERESNDKSRQQNNHQQQKQFDESHDSSSQQQTKSSQKKQQSKGTAQPIKNDTKEQEMQHATVDESANDAQEQAQAPQFGSNERWMARVLDNQEKADKAAQKALVKTNLNKQLAGRNGQNCW